MNGFIYHIIRKMQCKGIFLYLAMLTVLPWLAACYQMDADAPREAMAEKRTAQAYIVTSYNKLNTYLVRSDFEALGRLGSVLDEYQWDNKETTMQNAKQYAQMIIKGDVSALQDIMDYCERNSGVYEADDQKFFHKTADAEHQIKMIFPNQTHLSVAWEIKEKSSQRLVINLSLDFNQYHLAGQSQVYPDSVSSSYRMTKGDVTLMKLERTMKGKNILAAIYGESTTEISLYSTDLRLQLMDLLCLHETETELDSFIRYFEKNHTLQVDNPKKFLEGYIQMRDNMSRLVLTQPDGTVLCKVTDEVGMRDGKDCILPMLNWSDGTQQSLTEFASSSVNENFSKDGAMLDKLWQLLYNLYYEEEE